MTRSELMRVPRADAKEIKKIAKQLKISVPAAFRLWKQKKLNIKWENY